MSFKINHFLGKKNFFFTIFQLGLSYFVMKIILVCLNYFADIRFNMFESHLIDKNIKFSRMKILQCIQSGVVVNFNNVIRIAHCAVNI